MRPITFPTWEKQGARLLGDVYDSNGFCSFQEIRSNFNLPGASFFFYLQLRASLKAYGVPWGQPLPVHPLYELITTKKESEGLVSVLYNSFLKSTYKPLPLDRVWRADMADSENEFNWETIWSNIKLSSRNPNHQQIHFNFVHRTYLTPRKLHLMNWNTDPLCHLCPLGATGTFVHMFWECPPVATFWKTVTEVLSNIVSVRVPVSMPVLLLNDFTCLPMPKHLKCMVLAGLTAAKKMLATRWKPPHELSKRQWMLSFLDVIYMEQSTARINGAKGIVQQSWSTAAEVLSLMCLSNV